MSDTELEHQRMEQQMNTYYDTQDPLAPAKGMMVGLLLGGLFWFVVIGSLVWLMN